MGLFGKIRRLVEGAGTGMGIEELARRLDMTAEELQNAVVAYREFHIPKRGNRGTREIAAPEDALKNLQRRILRRLLTRLRTHPAVHGFERGKSIVTNACPHVGKAVVLHMDLKDFFPATSQKRVRKYFKGIGWNNEASDVLTRLCTHKGGLPQGAPTSPRLSNLANYAMDTRLAALAKKFAAAYTRYADDMTFSFDADDAKVIHNVIGMTKLIVADYGYRLHQHEKLHIRRRYEQQTVTGLVVNEVVGLSRKRRRWLRAVQHHLATGREATLTPAQLQGWGALENMIVTQSESR